MSVLILGRQVFPGDFYCVCLASAMEVDTVDKPDTGAAASSEVMAVGAVQGSVRIELHPLVVLNVSEHWTRVKAQAGSPRRVVGALIGKQEGRKVELHNSFEVVVLERDQLDLAFFREKEEQFKKKND